MRALSTVLLVAAASMLLVANGCSSSTGTSACGPDTCNGCCSSSGQCLSGDTEAGCGTAGALCSVCLAGQVCAANTCQTPTGGLDDGGTRTDGGTDEDGGTADAGIDEDGGMDGGVGTEGPIVVPAETWTWVDFPKAVCGNGSSTGIGINPTSASTDVFVYMEGGGACWDAITCHTLQLATNFNSGYGAAKFAASPYRNAFAVDRAQQANPFRDMSFVYIPYCSGDVHAGDSVVTYGDNPQVYHKGARNVEAYLERLPATFPNATRIFLTGSSAGGFGAQLNFERFAAAFPNAEIHVLADSAQMVNPSGSLLATWQASWNLLLPEDCIDCYTDFTLFPEYLATTYTDRRFGLTAYTRDGTLTGFFGYTTNAAAYEQATLGLLADRYDPHPNAHYFLLEGNQHTMLGSLGTVAAPGGKTLNDWVTEWVNGDSSWSSVAP